MVLNPNESRIERLGLDRHTDVTRKCRTLRELLRIVGLSDTSPWAGRMREEKDLERVGTGETIAQPRQEDVV